MKKASRTPARPRTKPAKLSPDRLILKELRTVNTRLAEISEKLDLLNLTVMNADASGEAESAAGNLEVWLQRILKALESQD